MAGRLIEEYDDSVLDPAHRARARAVVDFDAPETACPACGTVFETTATRCPDCGLNFGE